MYKDKHTHIRIYVNKQTHTHTSHTGFCLLSTYLCLCLSLSLLKLLEHSLQTTSTTTVDACARDILASLPFTNPTRHKALHPALDLSTCLRIPLVFPHFHISEVFSHHIHPSILWATSGSGCGSQLSSITFGSLWSASSLSAQVTPVSSSAPCH